LLSKIIEKTIEKLSAKQTTEEEFESSIKLLKSSITNNYSGILLKDYDGTKLIKKGTKILDDCLEDCDCLALGKGEGSKSISLQTFFDYRDKSVSQKNTFEGYRKKFTSLLNDLINTKNELINRGDTTQDREAKKKYDQYIKIESQIKDKQDTKSDIEGTIREIEKEIKELRDKLKADENQKREIDSIKKKQEKTSELIKIAQNSRSKYLDTLLNQVNKLSSEFLREVVKDKNRFHSIEIDSNYHFKVKQRNGNELEEGQINRGNVQLSMMSFFFGLSKFLAKKIPYVIDDPLLRLDPGHDKRLIKQLSTINEQIIFHMIPGKEYTTDSYKWLKSHINIQNWLFRQNYRDISEVSYTETKNPDEMIEFDIDKF
jgi:DNA sulfur modification protein DndD